MGISLHVENSNLARQSLLGQVIAGPHSSLSGESFWKELYSFLPPSPMIRIFSYPTKLLAVFPGGGSLE